MDTLLLHPIAEMYIGDRYGKKSDCDSYPDCVLHCYLRPEYAASDSLIVDFFAKAIVHGMQGDRLL